MLPGFGGRLVSEYFAEQLLGSLFAGQLGEPTREAGRRALTKWWQRAETTLGPASSVRSILDCGAVPLFTVLGFEPRDPRTSPAGPMATLSLVPARLELLVVPWGERLDGIWRVAVRHGILLGASWCACFNGRSLRIVDTRKTFSRTFLEFQLGPTFDNPGTFSVFWALMRAETFSERQCSPATAGARPRSHGDIRATRKSLFDTIVEASARSAAAACRCLRSGVFEALLELLQGFGSAASRAPKVSRVLTGDARPGSPPTALAGLFEQCLTIVYRILFLLFAEARGLVPVWHPVYREGYAIESLAEAAGLQRPPLGIWEALQAVGRLAHSGCKAGDLVIAPFNGRLFAPGRTPLAEKGRLDDERAARVLLALTTRPASRGDGRERISYRDLGVEELGAVYETVLDYEPAVQPGPADKGVQRGANRRLELIPGGGKRKATGSFYTPRPLTDHLVRQTLAPLVERLPADGILQLRILDPAMGSGAFLVSACRYLAGAYEAALLREGGRHASDITVEERAGYRRMVGQRCLYGVDLNPMAVQLSRLSLWLATLAAERPLTFLDHRLVEGDSLVGASPDDVVRQPPGSPGRRRSPQGLPLFDSKELEEALVAALPVRRRLELEPDDTTAIVRDKERALARLSSGETALTVWKSIADAWCACWFWDADGRPPGRALFSDLVASFKGQPTSLPVQMLAEWKSRVALIASSRRFLHWTLCFPEVFYDDNGHPLENGGFDAVLGNPPWEMVRGDHGDGANRREARLEASSLLRFARDSGIYTASVDGHANQYQLFLERACRLLRRGGRLGMVLPWGLAVDKGSAGLRRMLLERCDVDALTGFENTRRIFQVHRSVRFLLVTATKGRPTTTIRCRFGENDAERLDELESAAPEPKGQIRLTPRFVESIGGPDLAIPWLRSELDVAIVERITSSFRPLSDASTWGAKFGRELNASDDRAHFRSSGNGIPVVEGKHLRPFEVDVRSARFRISAQDARRLLARHASLPGRRLAYRDVAAATNRLTLIAAILPADTVSVHTIFVLKTALDSPEQAFLCAVLNSYVANYLVRLRVTTHVGVSVVERLPVPCPPRDSRAFREVAALSAAMIRGVQGDGQRKRTQARLQALVASLYGTGPEEMARILEGFSLISREEKLEAQENLERLWRVANGVGSRLEIAGRFLTEL
jgi:hypothetical protein